MKEMRFVDPRICAKCKDLFEPDDKNAHFCKKWQAELNEFFDDAVPSEPGSDYPLFEAEAIDYKMLARDWRQRLIRFDGNVLESSGHFPSYERR